MSEKKIAADVSGVSSISKTYTIETIKMDYNLNFDKVDENKKDEKKYDMNEDGSKQNQTIADQAEKLEKEHGKRSVKSVAATFWVNDNDARLSEFNRLCLVFKNTARWILFGPIEKTEENKKSHCHIAISFNSSKMFKTLIKTLKPQNYHLGDKNGHIEIRKYDNYREYCLKENPEDFLENGDQPKQGARNDLKKCLETNEYNIEKIKENQPDLYCRYRSGLSGICESKNKINNIKKRLGEYKPATVYWHYGQTGTGKTREVLKEINGLINKGLYNENDISFIDSFENGFAIGDISDNTKILVIDDFRGSMLKFNDLLKLIDGCNLNIKGGKIFIKAEIIYITSPFSPLNAYTNLGQTDSIKQLLRRLKDVREFVDKDKKYKSYEPMSLTSFRDFCGLANAAGLKLGDFE